MGDLKIYEQQQIARHTVAPDRRYNICADRTGPWMEKLHPAVLIFGIHKAMGISVTNLLTCTDAWA
jgi:hypothetical protein